MLLEHPQEFPLKLQSVLGKTAEHLSTQT
jgi:hypothetical protein